MKFNLKGLYHFLGGVKFAIFLILTLALFVIAGTLIESKTESHIQASRFTYSNPFFALLIWGFFINILFSATRRWPFKKKHIPFLITHLGLLMMLSGVLIKSYFGTQGSMIIMEGSGSDEILLPNTFALHLEDKNSKQMVDLDETYRKNPDLNIKVLDFKPHSKEVLETWIKDDKGYIFGIKPFALQQKITASLLENYPDFDIMAFRIDDEKSVKEIAEELYLKDLQVALIERKSANKLEDFKIHLNFDFTPFLGFSDPFLKIKVNESIEIVVPLNGSHPESAYIVDIKRKPLLAIIQDKDDDIFIFVYDKAGRVLMEPFLKNQLNSYIAYNKGFNGYSVPLKFPINLHGQGEIETSRFLKLKQSLEKEHLIPPLEILKTACEAENVDFADTCVNYLINDESYLPKLDFKTISHEELKASAWVSFLVNPLLQKSHTNDVLFHLLELGDWPFTEELQKLKNEPFFTVIDELVGQIIGISSELPDIHLPPERSLFSAFLKVYGIRLENVLPRHEDEVQFITLETPLTHSIEGLEPLKKIEENLPFVSLKVNQEQLFLTYDPTATGIKWPILGGRYLFRFQPKLENIPYRVRLQNARQINYPGSNSSFSYEADLIVTDKKNLSAIETTISMNNVHETWDGYRFYLSNISPGNELSLAQAQIVVNHDPAKYYLTYPGAMILTLGIILLFSVTRPSRPD